MRRCLATNGRTSQQITNCLCSHCLLVFVKWYGRFSLFSPTLRHDFEIPVELWNDHIVPDHILLGRPGRNELEAAEEMRNEDVQLHIRKTVILSQLLSPTRNVRCA